MVNGRVKVGVTADELKVLARVDKESTLKTSRRDLAYVVSRKLNGGTTVAGTLVIANMVGIRIFATGGVGGVHRGGEQSLDISPDLIELGRSPVAVVSSGVKSILDIPKTLEYLVRLLKLTDNFFRDFISILIGRKPKASALLPTNVRTRSSRPSTSPPVAARPAST